MILLELNCTNGRIKRLSRLSGLHSWILWLNSDSETIAVQNQPQGGTETKCVLAWVDLTERMMGCTGAAAGWMIQWPWNRP